MAKGKRLRRRERRARLSELLHQSCDPLMFSLGFRRPAKADWGRWLEARKNVFVRYVDGEYDEVILRWRSHGRAAFWIEFGTTRRERMAPPGAPKPLDGKMEGHIAAWRLPIPGIWVSGGLFGPFRSMNATVALAMLRLRELNSYLRTGEPMEHIQNSYYVLGQWRTWSGNPSLPLFLDYDDPWGAVSFENLADFGLVEPLSPISKRKGPGSRPGRSRSRSRPAPG